LREVIKKGHKIKIIHTLKRDLNELLKAIDYWLPLYMTGRIEPYFYPHYNRHVFQRTLFIAPGVAALTSNTFAGNVKPAEQFYYRDQNKINDLAQEFNQFLEMCRPLMRIFKNRETYSFNELQLEFDQQTSELTTFSDMLSFANMPRILLVKLLAQKKINSELKNAVLDLHAARFEAFKNNLKQNKIREIVYLPDNMEEFLKKRNLKLMIFTQNLL
jgi:hypothetical protein